MTTLSDSQMMQSGASSLPCLSCWRRQVPASRLGSRFIAKGLFVTSLVASLLWFTFAALAQQIPHLAYVYPAGGQQGATFKVTVGGDFLRNVVSAHINEPGIQAVVLEYDRPMNQKEFSDLRDQLKQLRDKWQASRRFDAGTDVWTAADQEQLAEIRAKLLKNPPNRQVNPALAESVLLKVSIGANVSPGDYEIRLRASNGLSNPLKFCVGQLREFSKPPAKSTDPDLARLLARLGGQPVANAAQRDLQITLPATVNGQIMPGGVDRYSFSALKGQDIVISIAARALMPYLADAVPGWFEATATLYDAKGNELAYDDRFRFRPDPVIHFTVPRDGSYLLEIHDSIYRGREDFVYRMTIGELPFITDIFPLGGPAGAKTTVQLTGWNLPARTLTLDNTGRQPGIYPVSVSKDGKISNVVPFAVGSLPECRESGPHHTPKTAQAIALPVVINGRINFPGDERVFCFKGDAQEQIVAEVLARRLGSPLDSTLELTDAAGKRLAFNDDYDDEGAGLETDHADSYLSATLPADGTYFIRLRDAQQQGGPAYAYRLRLSEPRPDFTLRITPSSLNVRAGMNVPVTVYALRQDGFTNAIELFLKDPPPGFTLSGAQIQPNQAKAQFTLRAPPQAKRELLSLRLEGRAFSGGQEIVHRAVPAEYLMQAFAYWHIVPEQDLEVAVAGNPRPFAANARRRQMHGEFQRNQKKQP
jgi:hypothetical protein